MSAEKSVNSNQENTAEKKKRPTKSQLKFRRFCAVLIILLIVWWFNNYTLKTTVVTLKSDKIAAPVRIAVISDLHAAKHGIGNDTITRRICEAEPDMVMILGDMYTFGSDREVMQIPIDLAGDIIGEGYPVYLVTGEHDVDKAYVEAVAAVGAKVMNYESEIIEVNGNRLQIFGIDNVYYSDTFNLRSYFTPDESCYSILLAHIPNFEKLSQFGADLTICADTHGEIIQLPFNLGPVYYSEQSMWLPKLLNENTTVYDKGIFEYKDGAMFITSGIGNSPLPARFNNRPEIAVIDIIPE